MTTTTPKSWRDVLPVHPAAELFPMMSREELLELGEDIKANGLRCPIVLTKYRGAWALVDGRNRLDAMELVGIRTVGERGLNYDTAIHKTTLEAGDDPVSFVLSANIHRRHLTAEQMRDLIAKLLKATPNKSNRQIAEQVKADHKTVARVRNDLEDGGEIPHHGERVGSDGVKQPATKSAKRRMTPDERRLDRFEHAICVMHAALVFLMWRFRRF